MDRKDDFPASYPPRREIQGTRPSPLRVRTESHKIIKKPTQQDQPRIIYDVSPKVFQINPSEFKDLVQRLTGLSPETTPFSAFEEGNASGTGGVSPAARYATMEKANETEGVNVKFRNKNSNLGFGNEGLDQMAGPSNFPGILSPGPNCLPPIPPSFFHPPESIPGAGAGAVFLNQDDSNSRLDPPQMPSSSLDVFKSLFDF